RRGRDKRQGPPGEEATPRHEDQSDRPPHLALPVRVCLRHSITRARSVARKYVEPLKPKTRPIKTQRSRIAASLGHHKRRQSLAITADAQFPIDLLILGRSCSEIFLNPPRYILGLGLAVTDRRLLDAGSLPGVAACSPRGLRTGA